MNRWYVILRYILLGVLIVLTYQNCSPIHDAGTSDQASLSACEGILKPAFESIYHSTLTKNCASCHGAGGVGKGFFAEEDLDLAFDAFMALEDGKDTKVADYAVNPSHNPPFSGVHLTDEINAGKAAWSTEKAKFDACIASKKDDDPPTPPPEEQPRKDLVDKAINGSDMYKTITWNLDSEFKNAADNITGNVTLSLEIQEFTSPTDLKSYRVRNPILTADTQALQLTSIKVNFNGSDYALGTAWLNSSRMVPANDNRQISSGVIIINVDDFNAADTIAPTIIDIKPVDFAPATFTQLMANVFTPSCNGCHGGASPSANLDLTTYDNFVLNKMFIAFDASKSEVYIRMEDTVKPMPTGGLLAPGVRKQVKDWILDGAPNN